MLTCSDFNLERTQLQKMKNAKTLKYRFRETKELNTYIETYLQKVSGSPVDIAPHEIWEKNLEYTCRNIPALNSSASP